jgi:hypothetical protein
VNTPAWIVPAITTETLQAVESAALYAFHEASAPEAGIKIANQCRAEINRRLAEPACDLI